MGRGAESARPHCSQHARPVSGFNETNQSLKEIMYGNATTSNVTQEAFTLESILRSAEMLKTKTPEWDGKVFESLHAVEMVKLPNRPHVRRRSQTERYHQRIQKKWDKRFGVREYSKPAIFKMQDPLTSRTLIMVHPTIAKRLPKAPAQPWMI